jgi:ribose transport system ATP-binding protein
LLRELANQGIGVIMISSELPEVIGMCDRVLVMHEGHLCDIISGDQITEERIIQLASGLIV